MTTRAFRWQRGARGAAVAVVAAAALQAGATPAQPADCTVRGEISTFWTSVGGARSWLGACVTDERSVAGGVRQDFVGGAVYWNQATGTTSVRGDIKARYDRLGASGGQLGVPVTHERPTPLRPGAFNHFRRGSIYWSPVTGAHAVWGAVRDRWAGLGWESSRLGFPTTGELRTPARPGAFHHFQGGSVYWSPATGAHPVWGTIRDRWASMGWENSSLGFPTSAEYGVPGGVRQDFQNGSVTWDARTGATSIGTRGASRGYGPGDQVRAAFYYGWFPSSFQIPGTRFHPSAGRYSTQDPAAVQRQIAEMRYAGIQAGIASWWGPETIPDQYRDYAASVTDRSLRVGLAAAEGTPFTWGIYYEDEAAENPPVAQLRADLHYVKSRYAGHPNFLYRNGKPVVFVWPGAGDTCEMVRRWEQAAPDFYVVQKVFAGWQQCAALPDSWHQYAPAQRDANIPGHAYSVSAGFHKYDEAPRLSRDAAAYDAAVARMRASGAPWHLVTTYNEWGEGTAVEPAAEWQSPSGRGWGLDILRKHYGPF